MSIRDWIKNKKECAFFVVLHRFLAIKKGKLFERSVGHWPSLVEREKFVALV